MSRLLGMLLHSQGPCHMIEEETLMCWADHIGRNPLARLVAMPGQSRSMASEWSLAVASWTSAKSNNVDRTPSCISRWVPFCFVTLATTPVYPPQVWHLTVDIFQHLACISNPTLSYVQYVVTPSG